MNKQTVIKQIVCLFVFLSSVAAFADDKVVVISPHRKSIQREFIPMFEAYYKKKFNKKVTVEWLDQGGTSDDLRFVKAKFASNKKTSGIDIFWGGGLAAFAELKNLNVLQKYDLPKDLAKQIPETVAGIPLQDKTKTWYGAAMSSFGVFFNKRIMKFTGLEEPKFWSDLANPKFRDQISLTDPRRSGTAKTMNVIILKSNGWDKGWRLLTEIAGNTRQFTHSSSDPIKAVTNGDAAAAMAIDFYAVPKIAKLGKDNLGFSLPAGQTIIDPDPIAMLKGAPNKKVAAEFINFVLSVEAQKLLVLPKGAEGGPKHNVLGRMSVNKKVYELTEGKRISPENPFAMKSTLEIDMAETAKIQSVLNDLIGSTIIDVHKDLKKAWARIVKDGMKKEAVAKFSKPFVTEEEVKQMAKKWQDEVFRNKTMNSWTKKAKERYRNMAQGKA